MLRFSGFNEPNCQITHTIYCFYISHFSKFERELFNKVANHSNLNDSDIVYKAYKGTELVIGAKIKTINSTIKYIKKNGNIKEVQ